MTGFSKASLIRPLLGSSQTVFHFKYPVIQMFNGFLVFSLHLIRIKIYSEVATQLASSLGSFIVKGHVSICLKVLVYKCRYMYVSLLSCVFHHLFAASLPHILCSGWKGTVEWHCSEGFCYKSLLKSCGLNLPLFHDSDAQRLLSNDSCFQRHLVLM